MTNYTVWIEKDYLRITPPIAHYDNMAIDIVLKLNSWGEIVSVKNKKDALVALYDEYQTNENIKSGDTFTFRGEAVPFAMAEGIHVVPIGW